MVGEGVILVGDQQDGGKKTSNFRTGKCILCYCRCFEQLANVLTNLKLFLHHIL
jgi:hypothetical protein